MPASYDLLMAVEPPHIVLTIDTKGPIELGDFVSAFTSLASQYEKFVREEYPDLSGEAKIFVREVQSGSIIADLIPLGLISLMGVAQHMDSILIVDEFVRRYGGKLLGYARGNRAKDATKSDLKDFMGSVVAIANDPEGRGSIESVTFEDGKREVRAAIQFKTEEARRVTKAIENHRKAIEHVGAADHTRVLMAFRQANVKNIAVGKRTGERVIIEEIQDKELPLIYASDLAEQQIKHEMIEADDNVFKKGFVVDVNVLTKGQRPVAYRVTDIHQVIDLPDDEDHSTTSLIE